MDPVLSHSFQNLSLEEDNDNNDEEGIRQEEQRKQEARGSYQATINMAYKTLQRYMGPNEPWTLIPDPNTARDTRVELYEQFTDSGHYLLKTRGILYCEASRVITMNADCRLETRSRWEKDDLLLTWLVEDFGDFRIVASVIKVSKISSRFFMGTQWITHNPKTKKHILIFQTCEHRFFPCPKQVCTHSGNSKFCPAHNDYVVAAGLSGIVAEELEPIHGKPRCMVTAVAYVHPKGKIPDFVVAKIVPKFKEKYRERMYRYEEVAGDDVVWKTMYGDEK